ncbi:urea ABC transporter permease subunit UrtC [Pontibaca salina]|uniref:Urea ABC transporter permease subunit UrtC n=1 Tax=Pontibaca salina TaxID=2795731 RepID=A0A934HTJ3_9RHOB|nr:urea ABC transporter permease subunit UrtC [Pontibaca salina]MBI6629948.1 urea ABC transporter permease subunit UrtC [Pontibaca salina]
MTDMLSQQNFERLAYVAFIAFIFSMPLFLDEFGLNRFSKYLVYGMLGIAISLAWGYAGILNLGQGLFFGIGAYAMAFSLKLAASSTAGGKTPIPDFMVVNAEPNAIPELSSITTGSWIWVPFQSQWFGVAMALAVPAILAGLIAYTLGRSRVSGVYVAIITLALVLLVRLIVIDQQQVTSGFNGLTDLAWFNLFGLELDPYAKSTYLIIAFALTIVLLIARWLVSTRAGLVLQGIRDNEVRARYLGYSVVSYQIFFFVVSAMIAGLAGVLYVVAAEFASPTFLDIAFSITMVVWAAVGGRASLLGACIGAIGLNFIGATLSETESLMNAWQLIIGLIFIVVVLWLPRGLAGLASDLADRFVTRADDSKWNRFKSVKHTQSPANR